MIRLAVDLPYSVEAPRIAREIVTEQCDALPEWIVDEAELLVSELVTNAVRYGLPGITLDLCVDPPRVGIGISDRGASPVHTDRSTAAADRTATSGRGLQIVDSVSSQWGVEPISPPPGKTVWFEISG